MRVDETSLRLLDALLQDGRLSYAELARGVGRSEATVRERVQRLQDQGILKGYRTHIDASKVGLGVMAIVRAELGARTWKPMARELQRIPNVVRADVVSGDRCLRIRLIACSVQELHSVLQERIMPLGLTDIDVRVVLNEIVPARPPNLETLLEA